MTCCNELVNVMCQQSVPRQACTACIAVDVGLGTQLD
jgi:hypothetical protein